MACVDLAPSQLTIEQSILIKGPDASELYFDYLGGGTVGDAKKFFSDSTNAPIEYVSIQRAGVEATDMNAPLNSGETVNITYTLAGGGKGGSFECKVKCQCNTHFPQFCQLGLCCNHCWIDGCHGACFKEWFCGHKLCCYQREMCVNADCGFHKLWKCEFCCCHADCGEHCCDVHSPKCATHTDFPGFCRCGCCCNHCWWDRWCCMYFSNIPRMNCCDSSCLCANSNCGFAFLGDCELCCLECSCCSCNGGASPHSINGSTGGWCTHTHGGGTHTVTVHKSHSHQSTRH